MNNETVAVIQARMGSERLPGKSLRRIGDWSMIELVLVRVSQSSLVDHVILATSTNSQDDVLAEYAEAQGYAVYRGSESDVLSRFFHAAERYDPSIVVRITGDCPLISPKLIDVAVQMFKRSRVDYLTLSIGRQKALAYPRGFDVEVVDFKALVLAQENATESYEREHVTPYLYTHPELFSVEQMEPPPQYSRPNYRLCVDTADDLAVILTISDSFGANLPSVEFEEIIRFLDDHPEVVQLNREVKQKYYDESINHD